jgi:hypothetical protein
MDLLRGERGPEGIYLTDSASITMECGSNERIRVCGHQGDRIIPRHAEIVFESNEFNVRKPLGIH